MAENDQSKENLLKMQLRIIISFRTFLAVVSYVTRWTTTFVAQGKARANSIMFTRIRLTVVNDCKKSSVYAYGISRVLYYFLHDHFSSFFLFVAEYLKNSGG